ncbi:MAG TPA: histidinol-phosphate transaminase [Dissulfurispiraceae bacterium]|nr:histidinol-phosphate transaminase [Dissulfurispiraceae bacterium]
MIKPRDYVSRIRPYAPGKPIEELERELGLKDSVKLASNENPLGPSPKALDAVRECLKTAGELHRYPDGNGYYLKTALSKKLSSRGVTVSSEDIILGNGSNELIDLAVRTFMGYGDEAVMAAPSFVVYSMSVQSVNGISVQVPLADFRHDLTKMAEAITEKTKLVFIANPNNPTGTINRRDEFEAFMKRVPSGVLVVIDEAYYEYVTDPAYPDTFRHLRSDKDILILRTFSKAYGLAGFRIGYGIAKKEILAEMNRIRLPFNTTSLSQVAARHALDDTGHLEKSISINEEGKQLLYGELSSLNLSFVPTEANFIYLRLPVDSGPLYNSLLREGVIIRPMGAKEVRVTIGLPEQNRRFIKALKIAIGNMKYAAS